MIPSTNSPISSRIVEARRSRYSSGASGSINPALKNMSKEALLKTPLSQLSSSDSTPTSSSSSPSTPLEPQSVFLSSPSPSSSSSPSPSPSQLQSSPSFSSLSLGTSSRKTSGLSSLNLGLTLGMSSGSSSGSPRVYTSNSNSNLNPNVSSSPSSSSSILEEVSSPYQEEDRQEVYKAILSGDVEHLNQVLVSLGVRSITTIPLPTSIKNHRERNWLHVAVSEGQHAPIISFLLKPQEDGTPSALGINDKTGYGSTPLHEAVEAGNFTTVVALLDLGAKVSLPTPEGILPLHAFVKNKLLFSRGEEDMYTFYRAFECLVGNSGSLVNTTTDRLETPLHYACISQQEECVRLLIRAEAKVNTLDKFNQTPLHFAVLSNNKRIAKLLIDAGADPNIPSFTTSALAAASPDDTEMIQILRGKAMAIAIATPSPKPATFQQGVAGLMGVTSENGNGHGHGNWQAPKTRSSSRTQTQPPSSETPETSTDSLSSFPSSSTPPLSKTPPLAPSSPSASRRGSYLGGGRTVTLEPVPKKPPRPISKRDEASISPSSSSSSLMGSSSLSSSISASSLSSSSSSSPVSFSTPISSSPSPPLEHAAGVASTTASPSKRRPISVIHRLPPSLSSNSSINN